VDAPPLQDDVFTARLVEDLQHPLAVRPDTADLGENAVHTEPPTSNLTSI